MTLHKISDIFLNMKINEQKIRDEAKRRKQTMTQFAIDIGINRQLLYHYMKKGATFSIAERLGEALKIDPKDLII